LELISETVNPFRHFGRTPRMGHWCITRPLPMWDSTTQKNMDIYPYFKQDSNQWSQC